MNKYLNSSRGELLRLSQRAGEWLTELETLYPAGDKRILNVKRELNRYHLAIRSFEELRHQTVESFADSVERSLPESRLTLQNPRELEYAEKQRVSLSEARINRLIDAIRLDPKLRFSIHWRQV